MSILPYLVCMACLPAVLNAAQSEPSSGLPNILRHPAGVSVRYPKDWTTKELPGGSYRLIPPGAGTDSQEVYTIGGQAANGIASAGDPRVPGIADQMMAQVAPGLRRVGAVERLQTQSAPGIVLHWEAGNYRAVAFIVVLKNAAISLAGLGLKSKIEEREAVLRQIFMSFSVGDVQIDQHVAGTWTRLGTTGLDAHDNAGRLQASSASDHQRTLLLRPDGSCVSRQVDRTIANSATVSIDTGPQVTVKNGRWFAGEGILGFDWGQGGEQYRYEVTGIPGNRRLLLKQDDGKVVVWQESR